MERGLSREEGTMKCRVCGGSLLARVTDLPFKRSESAIVILKNLPVLQCNQCDEVELEQAVMEDVDRVLRESGPGELEVIRYAA